MLYNKNTTQMYEREFKKRFANFCEKSPVLLSYIMTPTSVQVTDEVQEIIHEFIWDFTLSVKEFIHYIKQKLIKACYPTIIKTTKMEVLVDVEEQTELLSSGIPIDEIPTKKIVLIKKEYLLDKVIVYKDIFILQDLETKESFRYKLAKSSIFFLKKIRNGLLTKEEAGTFFFENSELLNQIELPKE